MADDRIFYDSVLCQATQRGELNIMSITSVNANRCRQRVSTQACCVPFSLEANGRMINGDICHWSERQRRQMVDKAVDKKALEESQPGQKQNVDAKRITETRVSARTGNKDLELHGRMLLNDILNPPQLHSDKRRSSSVPRKDKKTYSCQSSFRC
jgi:hypothetical protein